MFATKFFSFFVATMVFFVISVAAGLYMIAYLQSESLTQYVAVAVGLVFGSGAYLLTNRIFESKQANEEAVARQILEPFIPAGETLRAFTIGFIGPGKGLKFATGLLVDALVNEPRRQWYYVGVTQQSLAVVPITGNSDPSSNLVLRRSDVKQLRFDNHLLADATLTIQTPQGQIELRIKEESAMITRAMKLDDVWNRRA